MMTKTIDVNNAHIELDELLSIVEQGVEIILTDGDTPLARLVPLQPVEATQRIAGLHANAGVASISDDFWDTHSLGDYWDQTKEAEFEVRAMRRHRVTLDPEVYARIEAQAHTRGIVPETLVNLWLAERLQDIEA